MRRFKRNRAAWAFYEAQAASYRRAVNGWVIGAKREETREKRLQSLIEHSANGRRIPQFVRAKKAK